MELRLKREERRREIALAAAQLFAARGYGPTSMADVAAASEASKETLYAYFGSKEGLFREAMSTLAQTSLMGPQGRDPRPAIATTEALDAELRQFVEHLLSQLMQPTYLALARIVVSEIPRDPSLGELFRSAVAGPAIESARRLIERGMVEGSVDARTDGPSASRLLVGSVLTYVLMDGLLRVPTEIVLPSANDIEGLVLTLRRGLTTSPTAKESS